MTTAVIIADDQPVVVAGVKSILKRGRYHVVACANDTDALLQTMDEAECDVLVTNLHMPDGIHPDGMPLVRRIRAMRPDVGMVVMTQPAQPRVLRNLLDAGVAALFDKRSDLRHIQAAVSAADLGRTYLSPAIRRLLYDMPGTEAPEQTSVLSAREMQVLRAYAQGHSLVDISEMMHRSVKTISRQKRAAMHKLGLVNDAHLYQYLASMREVILDDWGAPP